MKSREKIFFLRSPSGRNFVGENSARRLRQKSQQKSADKVLQEVRHHSRTQTFAPRRQNSEQRAIHTDGEHEFGALVSVRRAKQHALSQYADRGHAAGSGKLLLQISTKNDFFAKSGGERQPHEQSEFQIAVSSSSLSNRLRGPPSTARLVYAQGLLSM